MVWLFPICCSLDLVLFWASPRCNVDNKNSMIMLTEKKQHYYFDKKKQHHFHIFIYEKGCLVRTFFYIYLKLAIEANIMAAILKLIILIMIKIKSFKVANFQCYVGGPKFYS